MPGWKNKIVDDPYNGYVQVWATAPEMAPAANLRTADGFLSPSRVRYLRTDS